MNVVYSSDENYVQHMAVSMLSLYKNNSSVTDLNVFVIANEITDLSKSRVNELAHAQGRTVHWIDFSPFKKLLSLDMEWQISISSYARLFLAKMLPVSCERAIYLDCDTIINDSLETLWNTDMKGCAVAGVMDLIASDFKLRVGLDIDNTYINAGILLIDLKCWRDLSVQTRFVKFINDREGRVTHHDQGVVNGTLKDSICVLAPRYNAMTPYFTTQYKRLLRFFDLRNYYTKDEINEAVNRPAIIHYTPEYVGRVWEIECRHPQAILYRMYLNETVWKGQLVHAAPLSKKTRLLYWMNRKLPMPILRLVLGARKINNN